MLPTSKDVHYLKQLVISAPGSHSAETLLLTMLKYKVSLLLKSPEAYTLKRDVLTIVQVLLEFDIPYKHFSAILAPFTGVSDQWRQTFWQHINHTAMYIKPTHPNIRQILCWTSCRKNPLMLSWAELEKLIHAITHTPPVQIIYTFEGDKYAYTLYGLDKNWHLHDCKKFLTWHFVK